MITSVHDRLERLIDRIKGESWENDFGQQCFLAGLEMGSAMITQEERESMILDTDVFERFGVVVTLDRSETPKTLGTGVNYMIKPEKLSVHWSRSNGGKWVLDQIAVIGPRVLKGDQLSDVITGRRTWYGNPKGDHRVDPPSWVLSIVGEVKPNGWKLETAS